ncbi:MAG TPA: ribonuclease III [Jatrophihabitans sp.]|nr:ribonuclease III [Jatrophihabitans sp.]
MSRAPRAADPAELADELGIRLDAELIRRALTHRSYAYENGDLPHNERLEFLGDSVLGVVITEALYRRHPELAEGKLAKLRASVVNMRALAEVARGIGDGGIGKYLLLGRGEDATGGRDKASILADTLEAILGAIHLEHGITVAAEVIHRLFDPLLDAAPGHGAALDWKTSLQELTAERGLGVPDYRITSDGPDHAKSFTAAAVIGDRAYDVRTGRNKKEAEQAAAEAAWRALCGEPGDEAKPDTEPVDAQPADPAVAIQQSGTDA